MKELLKKIRMFFLRMKYPNISSSSRLGRGVVVYNRNNLVMAEQSSINAGGIIMNSRAKLIVKKWSGSAIGLLAITGNHMSVVGMNYKQVTNKVKDELDSNHEMDRDIIIEEEVWIAARVTLLSGSHLGRGCEVGSGSVVRGTIPPYAVVIGNPCKIVGFRFTPDEIIEHEKQLYSEDERLPIVLLQKNYEKFFLNRIKEIKQMTKL